MLTHVDTDTVKCKCQYNFSKDGDSYNCSFCREIGNFVTMVVTRTRIRLTKLLIPARN